MIGQHIINNNKNWANEYNTVKQREAKNKNLFNIYIIELII